MPAPPISESTTEETFLHYFSIHSFIIHEEKTKEITIVKEVWISDCYYHKIQ